MDYTGGDNLFDWGISSLDHRGDNTSKQKLGNNNCKIKIYLNHCIETEFCIYTNMNVPIHSYAIFPIGYSNNETYFR